uniref:Proteoglycan 4a n=1 Tax=Oryzias melastigma TaxID=30732 RepID=A0A3B3DQ92_ORYME
MSPSAGSCVGRCGEAFTRGQPCTCDFSCMQHNECCPDFEASCTAVRSCQGRCDELFRRGRPCDCDRQCVLFNTCCHDYQPQCGRSSHPSAVTFLSEVRVCFSPDSNPTVTPCPSGGGNVPAALLPSPSSPQGTLPHVPAPGPSQPNLSASASGSSTPQKPSGSGGGKLKVQMLLYPGGFHPSGSGRESFETSKQEELKDGDLLTDLSSGVDLCGHHLYQTFRIHLGTPQRITETLGIPSPIDTAFTRTDCNRNTYIIKGDQYWQFDGNMVMKPGFPKPLTSEFPGLTGSISAALAVPATSSSPETVFFFKEGDIMLRFTFPPCSTPSLREEPRNSLKKNFAGALLSGEFNIRVSLKAFPTPVTAALSMHTPQGSDRYQHFIFSGPLFFKVHITGDLPAVAKPDPIETLTPLLLRPAAMATNPASTAGQSLNSPHPVNSIRFWLHCP